MRVDCGDDAQWIVVLARLDHRADVRLGLGRKQTEDSNNKLDFIPLLSSPPPLLLPFPLFTCCATSSAIAAAANGVSSKYPWSSAVMPGTSRALMGK